MIDIIFWYCVSTYVIVAGILGFSEWQEAQYSRVNLYLGEKSGLFLLLLLAPLIFPVVILLAVSAFLGVALVFSFGSRKPENKGE